MSRLCPAPLMVSHPNTVKPGTVQFQRQNSCHCWTSINFWSASPPSYGRKCSSPPDSDLKAPKSRSVPSQLRGHPRLVSTFSQPQEFVRSPFVQTANDCACFVADAQSSRIPQHRNCQRLSHTPCIFPLKAQSGKNTSLCTRATSHLPSCCSSAAQKRLWVSSQRQRLAFAREEVGYEAFACCCTQTVTDTVLLTDNLVQESQRRPSSYDAFWFFEDAIAVGSRDLAYG